MYGRPATKPLPVAVLRNNYVPNAFLKLLQTTRTLFDTDEDTSVISPPNVVRLDGHNYVVNN